MVTLIKMFYLKFECRAIVDNHQSESFTVESGMRQGYIISPILFLVAVDRVMRQTTADKPRSIPWTPFTYLEDLDFADDLAVLSTNTTHLQEKTGNPPSTALAPNSNCTTALSNQYCCMGLNAESDTK